MKNKYKGFLIFAVVAVFSFFTFMQFSSNKNEVVKPERIRSSSSPKAGVEMKKGRMDYFFNMVRDPETNQIPPGINSKEMEFAKKLNEANSSLNKFSSSSLTWTEAGPNDVGGRTRALAVDVTNPNIIIAGGISGGIWKSTNNGATWVLKSSTSQILSVTSITQDPRSGFTQNWYYTTGEFDGNSADASGRSAMFTGDGIYKSTNNGETWAVLPSTVSNITQWDSDFDFVSNIKVSPTTGSVFVASNGSGIFRSTDGGTSFTNVLGGVNHHIYSDVDVASDGNLLAILSGPFQGVTPTNSPGLYKSTNNGTNWTNIALSGYPATSLRSVIDIAPSNPNVAYCLTQTGGQVNNREEIKFYKINIGNGTSENRSTNIPDFSNQYPLTGFYDSQHGYDMIIAVKPDNENFVLIGGTNLFRSLDGFATQPTDVKTTWIGGYYPTQGYALYPNFHSDIHSFSFDPTDPKKMWWGNDGGLSYTTDITNNSFPEYFPWESKNNGYNVTQFYHISISNNSGDSKIMGGTQDNGTPFFKFEGSVANRIDDMSSGDGSYSYFGQNFAYTSSQNGNVLRLRYDQQNNPAWPGWSEITPTGSQNQLFINPFEVDPSNEEVMYYPAGNVLWRNNQLSSIPNGSNGTSVGWTQLNNLTVPSGYGITTLAVSKNPASILYYGATNLQAAPKIYKLSNSTTATSGAVEISIPGAQSGAYVHDIAVNPDDGNEILVVLSNYNITGLYHSSNGGQSYTAVEGNLEGTQQNPGPSLRSASILTAGSKTYLLGTSIGLFSTSNLNGNSTLWTQEGQSTIGNVVVSCVASRKSDGRVVVGTHGRGAFVGSAGGSGAVLNVNVNSLHFEVLPGLTRTKEIVLLNPGGANLDFNLTGSFGTDSNEKSRAPLLASINNNFNEMVDVPDKKYFTSANKQNSGELPEIIAGETELILDDGDSFADGFLGTGGGVWFYWRNDFQLTSNFDLTKVKWYMKTETSNSNPIEIGVVQGTTTLFDTVINKELSSTGKWYDFEFPGYVLNSLQFQNGETFTIYIGSGNTELTFPVGYDDDGLVPNRSHWAYYDPLFGSFWGWYNLNAIVQNGAFLIRAVSNTGGGGNQPPVAVAQVSPNPAAVNQTVNFNGSGSFDPDGTITQYAWVFGDGGTSNQMNTTHSYSQPGQYNYSLTVTDNLGATNQTTGQISVNDGTNRWTINPSTGTVPPGGQQSILITFDAVNLPEGNYNGQINITSNGGNINIPVTILVSNAADVNGNQNIYSYRLEQNFPNPFNPETTIRWSIAEGSNVTLKVFNLHGEQIATLVDEYRSAGNYQTFFNSANVVRQRSLASGVYFYTLKTDKYSESRKFILLK